jgi:hypothetical protein
MKQPISSRAKRRRNPLRESNASARIDCPSVYPTAALASSDERDLARFQFARVGVTKAAPACQLWYLRGVHARRLW